jgi:transposase
MATTEMVEIFNVLARRVRRAGVRLYRTPKSKHVFTQQEHLTVLIFKTMTRSSYLQLEMLSPLVLSRTMDSTTSCKAARRFGPQVLHRLLVACLPAIRGRIVAIDSTGFSTSTRSPYYTHRIFADKPCGFVKATLLVDTRTTAVLAAKIHIIPRHDLRDAQIVRHHRGAKHLVADKAYDAEWFHELLEELGLQPHIPSRTNVRKGFWRKKHAKKYREHIYHRRPLIETTNSVVKRRWGGNVAAHRITMIRIEILLKLVLHNLTITARKSFVYLMMSTQLWRCAAMHRALETFLIAPRSALCNGKAPPWLRRKDQEGMAQC